jgi:hypothetical protein
MSQMSNAIDSAAETHTAVGFLFRFFVIALTSFLTVVDLFATQAILPSLAQHYGVTAGAMGFAATPVRSGWRSPAWVSRTSVRTSTGGGGF